MYLILFLIIFLGCKIQAQDSTRKLTDSIKLQLSKSTLPESALEQLSKIISKNKFLNVQSIARTNKIQARIHNQKDVIFYALALLVFFLAMIKTFFARYFSNMFRVFFNSSLRQSQLTDQLMQEKSPSLFFNFLFIAVAAFYITLLFGRYYGQETSFNWHLFAISSVVMILIYSMKFLSLRFIGWISGYKQEANIYIFIIFLINKIIGICLIPLIIIMAFTDNSLVRLAILLSFILIGLMLIMRFLRSYGLLQHRLNVNRFHFLLYILAMEILPIALIYKAGMMFVNINL